MKTAKSSGSDRTFWNWGLVLVIVLSFLYPASKALARLPAQASTATPAPVSTPGPLAGSISVDRSVTPPSFAPGQEVLVELRLKGQAMDGCGGIPGRPVDMFLVFDISASAGAGPGSNWEQTANLTQALLNHLSRPIYRSVAAAPEASRVALVSSQTGMLGPEPVLLQGLTEDYNLLRSQVGGMATGGDTDLAAGVRLATEELAKARDDRAQAITLMLHDNTAVDESIENAVGEARQQGIPVYLVTNSLNIVGEKQITMDIARQLTPDDQIFLDPDAKDLLALFIDATEGDSDLAAANIQVVESFSPPGIVQVSGVTGPGGKVETDQVVWEVPGVSPGQSVDLSYRLTPNAGAGGVNIAGGLAWLDCNGYPQSTMAGALVGGGTTGPTSTPQTIDVQKPGATPTATISPTHTAAVPVVPPPDGGGVDTKTPGKTPEIPDDGFLTGLLALWAGLPDWLKWLLPLLLLLLLALLIWWLWPRKKEESTTTKKPTKRKLGEREEKEEKGQRWEDGESMTPDWREPPEEVRDRLGYPLTLRVRPKAKTVEQALADNKGTQLTVQLKEADQIVGRAEIELEPMAESDPLTGETSRWRRAKLLEADSLPRQEPQRRIGQLALERAEALAREHGAREMYAPLDSQDSCAFFEHRGYTVRRSPQGGYRAFKSLAS